jgi:hypothetical protein
MERPDKMRVFKAITILSSLRLTVLWKAVICSALFCFFSAVIISDPLLTQEEGNRLSISLDRQTKEPVPEFRNPDYILSLKKIQTLCLELAEEPRGRFFIEQSIEGTGLTLDDLMSSMLLAKQDDLYMLGFSLFTSADQERLRDICGKFAQDLARVYLERRAEFEEILSVFPQENITTDTLTFIILGCFSLDWDGLKITQRLGIRATFSSENYPFIGWVDDTRAEPFRNKKYLYWGGHSEYLTNGLAFTSFGDHDALPRSGLPDLAWRMSRNLEKTDIPEGIKSDLVKEGTRAINNSLLGPLGEIMLELRGARMSELELRKATGINQTRNLLAILENLDYIKQVSGLYEAVVPVFSLEDRLMIQDVIRTSRVLLSAWLQKNFDQLKGELKDLSAFKYGQPFEATFYKIWHELFGAANRILVEQGMFSNPYEKSRKYKGFIPFVWEMCVLSER